MSVWSFGLRLSDTAPVESEILQRVTAEEAWSTACHDDQGKLLFLAAILHSDAKLSHDFHQLRREDTSL